jgi:hypothetical protein
MWRNIISPSIYAGVSSVLILCSLSISFAQVMESTSYRIQSDSVNFAGGLSSSTSYVIESTAGEVGTGFASSTSYSLRAGYQQMQSVYISMTGATNVDLSPSIPGVTGGIANGSTTVTVITDSPSGYSLTIEASQSPAMQNESDSISDYIPSGNPDFTFNTGATDAHFGYTPEGVDVVQRFRDNGAVCNSGTSDTAFACWDGLSTTEETIAQANSANQPAGATTTIQFRVGVGGSVLQAPGLYTATTTITALPL